MPGVVSDADGLVAPCPRCGYDQRGMMAAWEESCPLQAVCTECGLAYSCAEVLRPEKFEPKWCIEYCDPRIMRFLLACAATLVRSLVPWRFWSRLKMSHRVQARRIALYLATLLLPLLVTYATVQTSAALYVYSLMNRQVTTLNAQAPSIASQPVPETDDEVEASLAASFGTSYVQSVKSSGEDHWQQMIEDWRRLTRQRSEWANAVTAEPLRIEGSPMLAALEAVLLPSAESTVITFEPNLPTSAVAPKYPAPSELWGLVYVYLMQRPPQLSGFASWFELIIQGSVRMGIGLTLLLLFPISLVLLPVTRRRAKVRWAHIGRITGYGMAFPVLAIYAVVALSLGWLALDTLWQRGEWLQKPLGLIANVFIPLCGMLWWMLALKVHLKLRHAIAVTIVHTFMCGLAVYALVFYINLIVDL